MSASSRKASGSHDKPVASMAEHIRQSNLIEGYDDPEFDKQSMKAWKFLARQEAIDRAVVQTLQKTIVESQDDLSPMERGQYRYAQVWVGDHQPPNALRIPELMESWLNNMAFYSDHTPKELHVEFEKIHPFVDGNGRTGRMLMWWHELKLGLEPTLIKASERQEYYKWFHANTKLPRELANHPHSDSDTNDE